MPAANAARPGAILAAERQRQGLSIEDVSNRLRFRPYQIEAIEREDYSKLPQGAFLRGFVKNYARLLALNPDRLLAALEEHLQEDQTPRIDVPTQNIRYDPQAGLLEARVNGAGIGPFPLALGRPRYAGFEGLGLVDNFVLRMLP